MRVPGLSGSELHTGLHAFRAVRFLCYAFRRVSTSWAKAHDLGGPTHRFQHSGILYAVHIVINRSDLSTGKRLDEGRGKDAKARRASRVRAMDKAWGLKQVERGVRNSDVHKKQLSIREKELASRGIDSYKTNLRELCRLALDGAESIYEYRETLESWGVDVAFRGGRIYVTDTDNARYSFSVTRLDADLDKRTMDETFGRNAIAREIHEKGLEVIAGRNRPVERKADADEVGEQKSAYLADIRRLYREYRDEVVGMEGTPFEGIPKLKLPRPAAGIANDSEVKRVMLACWRGADELRLKMSSTTVTKRKDGGGSTGGTQNPQREPTRGGEERQMGKEER